MKLDSNAVRILVVCATICLICSCSKNPQEPGAQDSITEEIDPSGGVIEWGDITVDVPEDGVTGEVTFTLSDSDYSPADSLGLEIVVENTPVSIEITGGHVVSTIFVTLPDFLGDDPRQVISLERDGAWHALEVVEEGEGILKVALPPELLQAGRDGSIDVQILQLILGWFDWPEGVSLESTENEQRLEMPALILVHGVLASGDTWDPDLIEHLNTYVGDVWLLEYPWDEAFWDVADHVMSHLASEEALQDRDLYFLCHSKGGLLSRAVIRQQESQDFAVSKAIFFGTPHYGTELNFLELLLGEWIPGNPGFLNLVYRELFDLPGMEELDVGSDALAALATEMEFLQSPVPAYFCIVGQAPGDIFVSEGSADLADESHSGERENALYIPTFPLIIGHTSIHKYNESLTWPEIYAFLVGGSIWIDPEPDQIMAAWVLEGPGGSNYTGAGDAMLTSMPSGEYSLTWGHCDGFNVPIPNPVVFQLAHLEQKTIVGEYSPDESIHVPAQYSTIQAAIEAASYGDKIVVAEGVYLEYEIVMKDGVVLESEANDPQSTVIDANFQGRVLSCNDLGAETVIRGFTIRNGSVYGSHNASRGGGIRCVGSSLLIEDCRFESNRAHHGGGIYCTSSATIRNCVFIGNQAHWAGEHAGHGGGIALRNSAATVEYCVFQQNSAATVGGGMSIDSQCYPHISWSVFANNTATYAGAGLRCFSSSPVLQNCTFYGNSVQVWDDSGVCSFMQSILASSGIALGGGGVVSLETCDVYPGGWGGDNINEDPMFCDPTAFDFSLAHGSPCLPENNIWDLPIGAFGVGCD